MPLLDFPPDMYLLRPGEAPFYGDFPELKKGVQWFVSQLPEGDWPARRDAVAKRFYQSLIGEYADPTGTGRYFDGKVAIVTGAASGIGKALATELVARGAHAALGFLDEIDDELAELFFQALVNFRKTHRRAASCPRSICKGHWW